MKPKLIAMDLDGTTVNSRGEIPPKVKTAIRAARTAGHVAAFVTGRADTDMIPIEKDCDCVDYLILNNGAKLIRVRDGVILENDVLDAGQIRLLFEFCRQAGILVFAISGRACYANMPDSRLAAYMDSIGCAPQYITSFEELPADRIEGVTAMGDTEAILSAIRNRGLRLRAVVSEPGCVDIMNPGINKWAGIEKLLSLLRMESDDVVAVGDYDNDLEMIRRAGIGVAVNGARRCIKESADYVTLSDNDHGAVADMINELILNQASGLCMKTDR